MIQITPHMRILVALEPIDFRVGIDGLVRACQQQLKANAFSGALFVFANRRRTAIKILVYDGNGFWDCHKRLSSGTFRYWPHGGDRQVQRVLQAHELTGIAHGRGSGLGQGRAGVAPAADGGVNSSRGVGELLVVIPRQP